MVARLSILLGIGTAIFSFVAQAQDVPGASDPPGLKRYQGSRIVHYATSGYAQYKLPKDNYYNVDAPDTIEGAVTRVVYLEPQGISSLEIFRNYEQMLASAGFRQVKELIGDAMQGCCKGFYNHFRDAVDLPNMGQILDCAGDRSPEYAIYKGSQNGHDVTITMFVSESNGCSWGAPDFKKPVTAPSGQVVTAIDVITSKTISNNMVVVKAADIADALATKGVFDLYGVYFDTDKTDVKSESTPTLDEVANLLKIDRSLRLEVSGHTDNTGSKDHNMKLSQGRAQSVVSVLVTKYGIDAKRLVAKGYGDTKPVAPNDNDTDKAKNRRVELRKI